LERTDAWELNGAATGPTANACTGNLRPGRYALAKTPIGVDVHLLSVHFDSGTTSRDYAHRRQATQRIGQIAIGNTPILDLDRDVLMLGDYNTMGIRTRHRCRPRRSSRSLMGSWRRDFAASL
jgi:endonuclease/exonuclease/phosphatase family metal-dependent hydrolase